MAHDGFLFRMGSMHSANPRKCCFFLENRQPKHENWQKPESYQARAIDFRRFCRERAWFKIDFRHFMLYCWTLDADIYKRNKERAMRLTDQRLLGLFLQAIGEASRGVNGYLVWKRVAWEWVLKNLDGQTQQSLAEKLVEHVKSGGEIDKTKETRPEYTGRHEFHYDFRFRVDGLDVYIETVLDETRTGPVVTVVSTHLK